VSAPVDGHAAPDGDTRPLVDARALTGPRGEAILVLDGSRYVLRITRQGKLILTK
jgi:hemin uptake protein HemP